MILRINAILLFFFSQCTLSVPLPLPSLETINAHYSGKSQFAVAAILRLPSFQDSIGASSKTYAAYLTQYRRPLISPAESITLLQKLQTVEDYYIEKLRQKHLKSVESFPQNTRIRKEDSPKRALFEGTVVTYSKIDALHALGLYGTGQKIFLIDSGLQHLQKVLSLLQMVAPHAVYIQNQEAVLDKRAKSAKTIALRQHMKINNIIFDARGVLGRYYKADGIKIVNISGFFGTDFGRDAFLQLLKINPQTLFVQSASNDGTDFLAPYVLDLEERKKFKKLGIDLWLAPKAFERIARISQNNNLIFSVALDYDASIARFSARPGSRASHDGQVSARTIKSLQHMSISTIGNAILLHGGDGRDGRYAGTSFSAPIISGAAALLLEAFPSLSVPDIRETILRSAEQDFYIPNDNAKKCGIFVYSDTPPANRQPGCTYDKFNPANYGRGVFNAKLAYDFAAIRAKYPKNSMDEVEAIFQDYKKKREDLAAKKIQQYWRRFLESKKTQAALPKSGEVIAPSKKPVQLNMEKRMGLTIEEMTAALKWAETQGQNTSAAAAFLRRFKTYTEKIPSEAKARLDQAQAIEAEYNKSFRERFVAWHQSLATSHKAPSKKPVQLNMEKRMGLTIEEMTAALKWAETQGQNTSAAAAFLRRFKTYTEKIPSEAKARLDQAQAIEAEYNKSFRERFVAWHQSLATSHKAPSKKPVQLNMEKRMGLTIEEMTAALKWAETQGQNTSAAAAFLRRFKTYTEKIPSEAKARLDQAQAIEAEYNKSFRERFVAWHQSLATSHKAPSKKPVQLNMEKRMGLTIEEMTAALKWAETQGQNTSAAAAFLRRFKTYTEKIPSEAKARLDQAQAIEAEYNKSFRERFVAWHQSLATSHKAPSKKPVQLNMEKRMGLTIEEMTAALKWAETQGQNTSAAAAFLRRFKTYTEKIPSEAKARLDQAQAIEAEYNKSFRERFVAWHQSLATSHKAPSKKPVQLNMEKRMGLTIEEMTAALKWAETQGQNTSAAAAFLRRFKTYTEKIPSEAKARLDQAQAIEAEYNKSFRERFVAWHQSLATSHKAPSKKPVQLNMEKRMGLTIEEMTAALKWAETQGQNTSAAAAFLRRFKTYTEKIPSEAKARLDQAQAIEAEYNKSFRERFVAWHQSLLQRSISTANS